MNNSDLSNKIIFCLNIMENFGIIKGQRKYIRLGGMIMRFKQSIKRVVIFLVLVLTFTTITPAYICNGPTTVEAATKVKLSKSKAYVVKGQTLKLFVKGTNKKAKWSSSNSKVARVNSKGTVQCMKRGTADIIAKIGKKQYKCKVVVETPSINKKNITLYTGKTVTLKINGTKQKVAWNSSNKNIATVSKKGVVKGITSGRTIITARVGNKKYNCKVTVKSNGIPVESVVLDKTTLLLEQGDKAVLQTTILPYNTTTDKTVNWSSSNTAVVTVSNGIVNAVGVGNATVTAKVGDKKATCYIEVSQAYGSISGNITYYYNQFKGNVADQGATVLLVPLDGSAADAPTISSYVLWAISSIVNERYNKYGIYAAKVDGKGEYSIANVPTGEYKVFVISSATTSGQAFADLVSYAQDIQDIMGGFIGSENARALGECTTYQKYTIGTVTIENGKDTSFSHDFGITYI